MRKEKSYADLLAEQFVKAFDQALAGDPALMQKFTGSQNMYDRHDLGVYRRAGNHLGLADVFSNLATNGRHPELMDTAKSCLPEKARNNDQLIAVLQEDNRQFFAALCENKI